MCPQVRAFMQKLFGIDTAGDRPEALTQWLLCGRLPQDDEVIVLALSFYAVYMTTNTLRNRAEGSNTDQVYDMLEHFCKVVACGHDRAMKALQFYTSKRFTR